MKQSENKKNGSRASHNKHFSIRFNRLEIDCHEIEISF